MVDVVHLKQRLRLWLDLASFAVAAQQVTRGEALVLGPLSQATHIQAALALSAT